MRTVSRGVYSRSVRQDPGRGSLLVDSGDVAWRRREFDRRAGPLMQSLLKAQEEGYHLPRPVSVLEGLSARELNGPQSGRQEEIFPRKWKRPRSRRIRSGSTEPYYGSYTPPPSPRLTFVSRLRSWALTLSLACFSGMLIWEVRREGSVVWEVRRKELAK